MQRPSFARQCRVLLPLLLLCLVNTIASACIWDYDTLAMERSRFPTVLELITGKFARHSPEYYKWRIQDRMARIDKEPKNVALLDDLATAYDKLGRHAEAVAMMEMKEAIEPGLYETYANLGTFHIHGGDLRKGLDYIDMAIEINPDAHFGREIYQKKLVEFILAKQVDEKTPMPLSTAELGELLYWSFPIYVGRDNTDAAIKGILGMMRFGNYESSILLEVLGDLLVSAGTTQDNANQLAARAYLKASYGMDQGDTANAYREMALATISTQSRDGRQRSMSLESLEKDFQRELADAEAWYAKVRENELKWIAEGADVDAMFAATYYEVPEVVSPDVEINPVPARHPQVWFFIVLIAVATVIMFILVRLVRLRRCRRTLAYKTLVPAKKKSD